MSSATLNTLRAREGRLQECGVSLLPKPFDMDALLGCTAAMVADTYHGAVRGEA